MVFTDINRLDDCVVALNGWNEVLRNAINAVELSRARLRRVKNVKYHTLSVIQDFVIELGKVVTRCILRLGQLA